MPAAAINRFLKCAWHLISIMQASAGASKEQRGDRRSEEQSAEGGRAATFSDHLVFNCTATLSVSSHNTMANLQSIPRFLLPRGYFLLLRQARLLLPLPSAAVLRYASSSSNPKTLSEQFRRRQTPVIPQPDKYRPPSHGKRTPRSQTEYKSYGPPITEEDKKRMRTKKYPNMMSPPGTFSHWFLNNKAIHLWITMVR